MQRCREELNNRRKDRGKNYGGRKDGEEMREGREKGSHEKLASLGDKGGINLAGNEGRV